MTHLGRRTILGGAIGALAAPAVNAQGGKPFAGTTLNQTHQAIEIIAITMAVYLAISLITSILMNWYNARANRRFER